MNLFDLLDRLRERLPEDRKVVALMTAASITAVIILVWFVSTGVSLRGRSSAATIDDTVLDTFKQQIDGTMEQGQKMLDSFDALTSNATTTGSISGTSTDILRADLGTSTDAAPVAASTTATSTVP